VHILFSNVTIVGLGKSGLSAALFLLRRGSRVSVTEASRDVRVLERARLLKKRSVRVEVGGHTRKWIEGRTLVVTSPGVLQESLPLQWARAQSIPVIGEMELAAQFFPGKSIAVTGTNGKSTVTTLVGEILKETGQDVRVGGNLGVPFTELVDGASRSSLAVIEVSSFQLETIRTFRPWIAVVLNITPNHLDRYPTFSSYRKTKLRIFENQTEGDWALLEESEAKTLEFLRPRVQTFSSGGARGRDPNEEAVRCVARMVGVDEGFVQKGLKRFHGLEHRLEFAGERFGIRFINDSKSTNIASTLWAIDRVQGPGVWILGGRDKGADFRLLEGPLRLKARGVVAMGEAREKIQAALAGSLTVLPAGSLKHALQCARTLAQRGDSIVLSPACASFDEFTNFEERGKAFKALILNGET